MCAMACRCHTLPEGCQRIYRMWSMVMYPSPENDGGQNMTLTLVHREEPGGGCQGHPSPIRGKIQSVGVAKQCMESGSPYT